MKEGTDSIRNGRTDRDIARSNQSLLIHVEIGQIGVTIASGEDRNIVAVSSISGAYHCRKCGW